jgi:hypothetical protein
MGAVGEELRQPRSGCGGGIRMCHADNIKTVRPRRLQQRGLESSRISQKSRSP